MAQPAQFASAHSACSQMSAAQSLKASRLKGQKPVDLVHLSRQSLGDRELEDEILNLFRSQSVLYLERLRNAKTRDDRKMAAHTILGSARGIGAWRVAYCAEPLARSSGVSGDVSELAEAIEEANSFIQSLG